MRIGDALGERLAASRLAVRDRLVQSWASQGGEILGDILAAADACTKAIVEASVDAKANDQHTVAYVSADFRAFFTDVGHPWPRFRDDVEKHCREHAEEVRRSIAAIWQEVLGIEQLGSDDNFFALGGDSLFAMNGLESYIRHGASRDVCRSLRMAWDVPALRSACQERLLKMDTDGWERLAETVDVPPEWLSAALDAVFRGGSFAAVNAPARLVASRVADLTAQQITSLWAAAKTNNQLAHSGGLRAVINGLIQSDQLRPSAARHVVEEIGAGSMYEDEFWWPAVPTEPSQAGS